MKAIETKTGYLRKWKQTDFWCISCRNHSVWEDYDTGIDYECGNQFMCIECGWKFSMPTISPYQEDFELAREIKEQLAKDRDTPSA